MNDQFARRSHARILTLTLVALAFAATARAADFGTYVTINARGHEMLSEFSTSTMPWVSVFAYDLTEQGDVVTPASYVPDTLDRLMANPQGRTIAITVVNAVQDRYGRMLRDHDGKLVHAILSSTTRRAEHVRQLAELGSQAHALEIDYESLPAATRPYFTTFIRELRAKLPSRVKLAVTLMPKNDNRTGDGGRAVDWRAIAPYVDRFRVMAYYYSWSTGPHGPVAPLASLRRLARYALDDPEQSIPVAKLEILLCLWGLDWPMPVGTPGKAIRYADAIDLARSRGVTPSRDPEEQTLHFRYWPGGVEHEVWIDDVWSIRKRIDLLEAEGIRHIGFWHHNTGDPRLWDWLADAAPAPAPGPAPSGSLAISSISPTQTRVGSGGLTVRVLGSGFGRDSRVRWDGAARTTTYVSPSEVRASIPASDLDERAYADVTVSSTTTGAVTDARTFTVRLVPRVDELAPASRSAGSPGVTVTLYGSGFAPDSVVRWNGQDRYTTYVAPSHLRAWIPASDLAYEHTAAVTVFNPSPGGASYPATPFPVR